MSAAPSDRGDAHVSARRFVALAGLGRSLASTIHPDRVISAVVEHLGDCVGFERVELWHREAAVLTVSAVHPRDADASQPIAVGAGLVGQVARDRVGAAAEGFCAVPVSSLGDVIGVLAFHGAAYEPSDLDFLEAVGVQVGAALDSSRRFEEVMQLERLKADFISRISHELRTPITIISGFLTTLIEHEAELDEDSRRHMLERSQAGVDRLATLINDLLTMSKIETGVLRVERSELDLGAIVGEIAERYEPGDVALVSTDPAPMAGDPDLVTQALAHLIDNAVKYGGHADVSLVADDGRWRIEVTDPGPGIAPDVSDILFEVFTRSASTTRVPGLGLGLAMARTILDVIGGELGIGPGPGGTGTTASLTVPGRVAGRRARVND